MEVILQTEKSSLITHTIPNDILELVKECVETCDPELIVNPKILVYGKTCIQHRSVGFYSDNSIGYKYNNKLNKSKPLHKCLIQLLEYVNTKFNYDYNGILINKYLNGEEYISKHSDDEAGLEHTVGVISISYGAVRKFRIRNKLTKKIEVDLPTDPTKIIQMAGDFQKEFTHEIPVEKKVNRVRYSLTFRKHII